MRGNDSAADTRAALPVTPAEQRLAETRAVLESFFVRDPHEFPRSHTMRFLLAGKGRVVALGAFAGLMAVKPKFAMSLVRFLPLGKLLPVVRLLRSLR
jgi:hypothetical protein